MRKAAVHDSAEMTDFAEYYHNYVKDKWINVNDRLPEYGKEVIVYNGLYVLSGYLKDPKYYRTKKIRWGRGVSSIENITYWMPLPDPPKNIYFTL